ncbi:MAG: hypothetical protein A3G80_10200 [Betaproteobacteria bacterium RIFCSPLOWO2_12_FULL_62_13b]|nr:MAG: hypothetical protein A3G80_10200 [Betaproteobacteria bacterium RIFCSPLOWO2_12_FULL_62_13b]
MSNELLLVGSVPLETAEEVFRALGGTLGKWLPYMPDGEVGERQYWVDGFAYRVLNGHPDLETIRRPAPDEGGVERWRPRGLNDEFNFRVRPGVRQVKFGDPGWRLGYTRDAVNSYFVFRTLREKSVIPAHVKFQVCLPLSYSAVTSFFPDPEDHAKIVPGVTAAFRAEILKMVEKIPPADLAIQWDLAVENRYLETKLDREGSAAAQSEAERLLAPANEICPHIPKEAALGYHSCFGTLNGWPSRQPASLAGTVMLLNAAVAASGRRVDFLHFPTVGSAEESFFAPLSQLNTGGARVYIGAIHHLHGADGLRLQLEAARQFLPEFGIAAPCGFGRAPERPGGLLSHKGPAGADQIMREIIDDHVAAVGVLGEVLASGPTAPD